MQSSCGIWCYKVNGTWNRQREVKISGKCHSPKSQSNPTHQKIQNSGVSEETDGNWLHECTRNAAYGLHIAWSVNAVRHCEAQMRCCHLISSRINQILPYKIEFEGEYKRIDTNWCESS